MQSTLSKIQTFFDNNDKLTQDSFLATNVPYSKNHFDDLVSKTENLAEAENLKTSEKNDNLIETIKKHSTLDDARTSAGFTSNFVENVSSLLHEKKNLDKYDSLVLKLTKKLLKTSDSDRFFNELIKSSCNLKEIPQPSHIITNQTEKQLYEHLLQNKLYPFWGEMMCWNASSNILAKEFIFNTPFTSRRHSKIVEIQKEKANGLLYDVSKNDIIEHEPEPSLDFINANSNVHKFHLLCLFTNETDYEASSDFNRMHYSEDIRLILPMTWNIVVASNVLTISDENSQHITILFRNSVKAKFDYKYSKKPSGRKFKSRSAMDITELKAINRAESGRKQKLNLKCYKKITAVDKTIESLSHLDNKVPQKSEKLLRGKKMRKDSFLLLREPILLQCIERNKRKQVLMYKDYTAQYTPKQESKNSFGKTLEKLLADSLQYKGEPIHLVFEPKKLITRLKTDEINSSLNRSNYCKCKHSLIESSIYKTLLQYRNAEINANPRYENKALKTVLPENNCKIQRKNLGGGDISAMAVHIPKKYPFPIKKNIFNVNKSVLQKENTRELLGKPIVATHSYLDLLRNCSNFARRGNFDIDELFKENKPKLRQQMSRTSLKQINVKQIVSSIFRHFFHFYSLLDGNLRSGAVITRTSSNYWLQVAGVVTDSCTLKLAGELFTTFAGQKFVLNIFDYIKFLVKFARIKRLLIKEVVKKMMVCEQLYVPAISKGKCKKCTMLKNQSESAEFCYEENGLPDSESLPNIWPPSSTGNGSYLSEEIF